MSKIPIIILHGWNLSGDKYKSLIKVMKESGFKVLAPDLPGFGSRKDLAKSLGLKEYSKFLESYLNSLSIKKVSLIGHSFGGRVAIKYSALHPERINKLILTGVPGFTPVNNFKIFFFYLISKIGKIILSFRIFIRYHSELRKILYKLAGSSDYLKVNGYLKDTFNTIIREDLIVDMKNIFSPTLLVWGKNDKTVPSSVASRMLKVIKNSNLIIMPNTNHKLPIEHPSKFFISIKDFIK